MPTYKSPGVYIEELDRGAKSLSPAGTAVAAFIGYTDRAPRGDDAILDDLDAERPRKITSWTEYLRLYGSLVEDAYLPEAVNGFFDNGGTTCYVVRIQHLEKLEGDDARRTATAPLMVDDAPVGVATMTVIDESQEVDAIRIDYSTSSDTPYVLKLLNNEGSVGEKKPNVAHDNVTIGGVEITMEKPPKNSIIDEGTYRFNPPRKPADVPPSAFEGDPLRRTGLAGLDGIDEITMVMAPDASRLVKDDPADALRFDPMLEVQNALVTHCENHKDRMAILDPPVQMKRPTEVVQWRSEIAMFDSKFSTLYYPWLQVAGSAGRRSIPPCGHMAGVWARTDNDIGVWKAPANATVNGILGVDHDTTRVEQESLNPIGINAIRAFGTEGLRVWGARTLSSDSSWRYVNVRRLFNMVETTIKDGTNWVVFEPNDPTTWGRVWGTLDGFLRGLWRQGAFFGATPAEAYYIKVDAETNPPDVRDRGELVVEVGFAPVKPAEFIIFRVSQFQSDQS